MRPGHAPGVLSSDFSQSFSPTCMSSSVLLWLLGKSWSQLARWLVVTCWYPAGMSIHNWCTLGQNKETPERLLCLGSITHPSSLIRSAVAGSCQTVRPDGCRGSGHSALVATWCPWPRCSAPARSLLRPSGSSFPALPGPLRPLGGATRCSSIRFLQLRPVGSWGGAGAAPGSCACTESAFSPCVCLLPTTAQGLESGAFSDRLPSC